MISAADRSHNYLKLIEWLLNRLFDLPIYRGISLLSMDFQSLHSILSANSFSNDWMKIFGIFIDAKWTLQPVTHDLAGAVGNLIAIVFVFVILSENSSIYGAVRIRLVWIYVLDIGKRVAFNKPKIKRHKTIRSTWVGNKLLSIGQIIDGCGHSTKSKFDVCWRERWC